jgi:hypothetical protein
MSRRFVQACLLALALTVPGSSVLAASSPDTAVVVAVQANRLADLVLLDAGFDAGLRQGMVCLVTRGGLEVAEVLLVELRPSNSAALIVSASPRQAIRLGDTVRIKLIKS